MRLPAILAALLLAAPVAAQEQQAAAPPTAPDKGLYDIVAADRETAWRINRVTGEVTVCRVDTTRVDGLAARCTAAIMSGPGGAQQSQVPRP